MKKLIFTLNFLALSVLFVSCSKTDNQLLGNENPATAGLKTPTANGGNEAGREADTPPTETPCPPTVVTLFAGQTINAGNVTVTNDANFIYVTYNTANGYVLTQTHLFVGACALIPVNRPGNPIPGQFPYASPHSNLTSYTYQIPITAIPLGVCGCIAAHAVVVKYNAAGQIVDQQTGWGNGTVINPTGNWGMKFTYCSCQ
ncbi:MAG: hypothetical protein LH615_07575 [Ferruginibacter sp.]|nr:hypothetical protein [Ferruginibacter sp.]